MPCEPRIRDSTHDFAYDPISERGEPVREGLTLILGFLKCGGHTHDKRHILCAGALPKLLTSAGENRENRRIRPDEQSTNPFGAIKLVSRYIRDNAEVQDVTQEAFIKAYRALANFRGDSAFYTWLYRIAINTAKNFLVSQGRRPPSSDIDVDTAEVLDGAASLRETATPERNLMRDEIAKTVQRAIASLPEDLRTAITYVKLTA